jgi:hypothetical protein
MMELVSRNDTVYWCFLRENQAAAASEGRGIEVDLRLVLYEELRAEVKERGSVLQFVFREQSQQGKLPIRSRTLLGRQPESHPTDAARDSKP